MRMERDLKARYHELLRANPAAILQHGGRQDSARHLCHLVAHAELKLLDKRVGLVIRAPHLPDTEVLQTVENERATLQAFCAVGRAGTHQPADLLLPVWCRAGRCFDHG